MSERYVYQCSWIAERLSPGRISAHEGLVNPRQRKEIFAVVFIRDSGFIKSKSRGCVLDLSVVVVG